MNASHIDVLMFASFVALLIAGVPVAVALGLAGSAAIALGGIGMLSIPVNLYAGVAKYPLLAIPMFVLAGVLYERVGIAAALVRFAGAIVGPRRGGLAMTAIMVAMGMGGIAGSGPAASSAVGAVLIPQMIKAGYPRGFAASIVAAGGATDILLPPSIAFVIYSMLVPSAGVRSLFAAGIVPGILIGVSLIGAAGFLARRHAIGTESNDIRPPFWRSLREAVWALMAPVLILGSLRSGVVTPTEAASLAVFYGLIVGIFVYRSLTVSILYRALIDACEISAVILIVMALGAVFAVASNALGTFRDISDAMVRGIQSPVAMLIAINAMLLLAGMFIDGISIFFIFLPLLTPIAQHFGWDMVWFGVLMTINIAIGQFHPPVGLNLVVTCRIANTSLESTTYWAFSLAMGMLLVLAVVTLDASCVLWLPRYLGLL
jgi:tripartite ATP-independent transporter DctM subunit